MLNQQLLWGRKGWGNNALLGVHLRCHPTSQHYQVRMTSFQLGRIMIIHQNHYKEELSNPLIREGKKTEKRRQVISYRVVKTHSKTYI